MFKAPFLLMVFLAVPTFGYSATHYVPDNFSTIQAAISASQNGDTVIVRSGQYVENIDFLGKAITVKSESGPDVTTIDGNQSGSVVSFKNGEGSNSVLEGFEITNGTGTGSLPFVIGGGIYCNNASPTVTGNTITKNSAEEDGGGIYCYNSSIALTDNTISKNWLNGPFGADGISCSGSSPVMVNNVFIDDGIVFGGGSITAQLLGNVFKDFQTGFDDRGAIYFSGTSTSVKTVTIRDNVFQDFSGNSPFCWAISVSGTGYAVNTAIIEKNVFKNIATGNTIRLSGTGDATINGHLRDNLFTNCSSDQGVVDIGGTGGVDVYAWLSGNVFSKCTTTAIDIGGISTSKQYGEFVNNTLVENKVGINKGGNVNSLIIYNTILWDNGDDLKSVLESEIHYSDIQDGDYNGKNGNISLDPLFVDSANQDYHIQHHSPCKETGSNAAPNLPAEDFEGDPRIVDGTVDMGCDEFHTHMYYTGDATPGGTIQLKFVGVPGTSPVGFWIGFSVYDPPISSKFGDWYLQFPVIGPFILLPIPSPGGVEVLSGNLPPMPADPYTLYMQAIIGKQLTNLCTMDVE